MVKVLDASALIAYLERRSGYEKVREAFVAASEGKARVLMASINWGEVFYFLINQLGLEKAEEIRTQVRSFPIEWISVDAELAEKAGVFKVLKKLGYADAFAAALAKEHHAELLTSDKDFNRVASEIRLSWVE